MQEMKNGHGDKVNLSAYGQRNTKENQRMPDLRTDLRV